MASNLWTPFAPDTPETLDAQRRRIEAARAATRQSIFSALGSPVEAQTWSLPTPADPSGAEELLYALQPGRVIPQLNKEFVLDPAEAAVGLGAWAGQGIHDTVAPQAQSWWDQFTLPRSQYQAKRTGEAIRKTAANVKPKSAPFEPFGATSPEGNFQDYLGWVAQRESGGNAKAKNLNSSASGPFQFVEQTWLSTLYHHGAEMGMPDVPKVIQKDKSGRFVVADPKLKKQLLDLRFNENVSKAGALHLSQDYARVLEKNLGRKPSMAEQYAAHVFGPAGATALLRADPSLPAVNFAGPGVASANRALFYKGGQARSVGALLSALGMGAPDGSGSGVPTSGTGAPGTGVSGPVLASTSARFAPPPEAPMLAAPDYSAADALWAQLAPKQQDPQALKREQMATILAGLSAGVAQGGTIGQMLARGGAGAMGGLAANRQQSRELGDQAWADAQRYAMAGAQRAEGRANTLAEVGNENKKIDYQNKANIWEYGTKQLAGNDLRVGPGGTLEITKVVPDGQGGFTRQNSIVDVGTSLSLNRQEVALKQAELAARTGFSSSRGGGIGLPSHYKERVMEFQLAAEKAAMGDPSGRATTFAVVADEAAAHPELFDAKDHQQMNAEALKMGLTGEALKNHKTAMITARLVKMAQEDPDAFRATMGAWAKAGLETPAMMMSVGN